MNNQLAHRIDNLRSLTHRITGLHNGISLNGLDSTPDLSRLLVTLVDLDGRLENELPRCELEHLYLMILSRIAGLEKNFSKEMDELEDEKQECKESLQTLEEFNQASKVSG